MIRAPRDIVPGVVVGIGSTTTTTTAPPVAGGVGVVVLEMMLLGLRLLLRMRLLLLLDKNAPVVTIVVVVMTTAVDVAVAIRAVIHGRSRRSHGNMACAHYCLLWHDYEYPCYCYYDNFPSRTNKPFSLNGLPLPSLPFLLISWLSQRQGSNPVVPHKLIRVTFNTTHAPV